MGSPCVPTKSRRPYRLRPVRPRPRCRSQSPGRRAATGGDLGRPRRSARTSVPHQSAPAPRDRKRSPCARRRLAWCLAAGPARARLPRVARSPRRCLGSPRSERGTHEREPSRCGPVASSSRAPIRNTLVRLRARRRRCALVQVAGSSWGRPQRRQAHALIARQGSLRERDTAVRKGRLDQQPRGEVT